MKPIIEVEHLTKFYGKNRGVSDLSLAVSEGEIFGFIGPNGAGKSTTIRALLGLISPTSGSAKLFGQAVSRQCAAPLADVGYMPAEAAFYRGMRAGEVIALSAKLRRMDCAAEARRLCERLRLDARRRVDELSLGNRKKVSIVCALQHRPALCILDEPTSGLDPLMQEQFFELLQERRAAGGTIFLSSHVLGEVQRSCHRAAVIREGRLIACDRVENLSRTRARRVTVRGIERLSLPGMADVHLDGGTLRFLYDGSASDLIAALQGLPVTDLTIAEPALEEIFLHFYADGDLKA
ncbi:MAG: ABC transporter ATP-binding protein [Clostridia bacterium]|nr:ABC transporter ATP-binding protein [Clostridia bacterium]